MISLTVDYAVMLCVSGGSVTFLRVSGLVMIGRLVEGDIRSYYVFLLMDVLRLNHSLDILWYS